MNDGSTSDETSPSENREDSEMARPGAAKTDAKRRDWIDWIQAVIVLGTAAVGLWLKVGQGALAKNLDDLKAKQAAIDLAASRERITSVFTDKLLSQIEKMDFNSDSAKEAFILELMEVDISAHLVESGGVDNAELQRVSKECRLIPQRIALYKGNTEALSSHDQKDWLAYAQLSGSADVKRSAMQALTRLDQSEPKEQRRKVVSDSLETILLLSRNFGIDDVRIDALKAVQGAAEAMKDDPADLDGNPALLHVEDSLRRLESHLSSPPPTAVTSSPDQEKSKTKDAIEEVIKTWDKLIDVGLAQPKDRVFGSVASYPVTSEPTIVGDPSASPIPASTQKPQLDSNDPTERRSARQELAKNDAETILGLLAKSNVSNFVRVGVAKALSEVPGEVTLRNPDRVADLLDLLAVDDVSTRKYAAEFLMRLYDPQTVKLVHSKLSELIDAKRKMASPSVSDQNALFNSVVVLGTWMRVLPDSQSDEKIKIEKELDELQKCLDPVKWKHTIDTLAELKQLASKSHTTGQN
jgi:hypothetical protein